MKKLTYYNLSALLVTDGNKMVAETCFEELMFPGESFDDHCKLVAQFAAEKGWLLIDEYLVSVESIIGFNPKHGQEKYDKLVIELIVFKAVHYERASVAAKAAVTE